MANDKMYTLNLVHVVGILVSMRKDGMLQCRVLCERLTTPGACIPGLLGACIPGYLSHLFCSE